MPTLRKITVKLPDQTAARVYALQAPEERGKRPLGMSAVIRDALSKGLLILEQERAAAPAG